jgi:anti-sigma28 factor (negative regulator of flagellin synthesis)
MAPPKSGKKDSNVLKLEDIRDKHKKSTRMTKSHTRSQNVNEKHILKGDVEKNAHSPGKIEQLKVYSKPDLAKKDVTTEVIETPEKRSLVSNRRFDKVKVERIKAQLADDAYEIGYLRVAEKFIEHERFS